VLAGHGITFISRAAVEAELESGALAAARVQGLEPRRQIFVARAAGRATTRAADAFLEFARKRLT
jgi:DNA-binding transcriptional LysR family regulator